MIYAFTKYSGFHQRINYRLLKPSLERLAKAKMEMIQDKYKGKVYFISTLQYPLLSFSKRCLHIDIVTNVGIKNYHDVIEVDGIRYQVYVRYHEYYQPNYSGKPLSLQSTISVMLKKNHFELYWLFQQLTIEESNFLYVDADFRAMIVKLFTLPSGPEDTKNKPLYKPNINEYLTELFQVWSNSAGRYFGCMFEEEYLTAFNHIHERYILLSRLHTLSFILELTQIALREKHYTYVDYYLMSLDKLYQSYFDIPYPIRKYNNITGNPVSFTDDTIRSTALLLDKVYMLIKDVSVIVSDRNNNELYDETMSLIKEMNSKVKDVYISRLRRIKKDLDILNDIK